MCKDTKVDWRLDVVCYILDKFRISYLGGFVVLFFWSVLYYVCNIILVEL